MATELGVFTGNEPEGVKRFEAFVGKPVDGVLAYTGSNNWGDADPGWQIGGGSYLGALPNDKHWSIPMTPDSGGAGALREAAAGQHNDKYTSWAKQILASDSGTDDIYVRTTWELGGEWFAWTGAAKEDPGAFKGAFQQFAKAFHDVSPRFKIVWDFVPDRGPVEQWYPGDEAVDVIGQDVYWHPQYDGSDPVKAFERHKSGLEFGLDYVEALADRTGAKIAIPEWGTPGNRADLDGAKFADLMQQWIKENADKVVFADYWDSTSAYDGLVSDGQPPATAAEIKSIYQEGIAGTPGAPTTPTTPTPPAAGAQSALEKSFLDLVNADRQAAGVAPLAWNGDLSEAAEAHSKWMLDTDTFSHTGANGSTAGDRAKAAGYNPTAWAENIAYVPDGGALDMADVQKLHANLMNSPGHKANLLDPKLKEIGIGLERGDYQGAGVAMVTEAFGTSATAPTTPTTPTTPTNPAPGSVTVGTGSDTLVLKVSQDAYQGDAQFTVKVDGVQVGGTLTAKASHASGQSDTVTVKGEWAAGAHKVDVTFLNDAGGTAGADRNLYLDGATYNGVPVSGAKIDILWNGPQSFSVTDAGTPATPGTPTTPTTPTTPDAAKVLRGTANADTLTGGTGADRLTGLDGNDALKGMDGADVLNGGLGNDTLDGGAGDDRLFGGWGSDALTGGAGADLFVFGDSGHRRDTVSDFNAAQGDRIDLGAVLGGFGDDAASLTTGGFLKLSAASGGVAVMVDEDGGGNHYVTMATLTGATVAGMGDWLVV